MEGKVEAFDLGRKQTLAEELDGIETAESVDAELQALKARLGNSVRPAQAK
jgi:phage shock protein A